MRDQKIDIDKIIRPYRAILNRIPEGIRSYYIELDSDVMLIHYLPLEFGFEPIKIEFELGDYEKIDNALTYKFSAMGFSRIPSKEIWDKVNSSYNPAVTVAYHSKIKNWDEALNNTQVGKVIGPYKDERELGENEIVRRFLKNYNLITPQARKRIIRKFFEEIRILDQNYLVYR